MSEKQPRGEQPQRGVRRLGENIARRFGFGKKGTPDVHPGVPERESQPQVDRPEAQSRRPLNRSQNAGEGEAKVKPGEYGSWEWAVEAAKRDGSDPKEIYHAAGPSAARGEDISALMEERSKAELDKLVGQLKEIADDPNHPMSKEVVKDIAEIEFLEAQRLRFRSNESSQPTRRRRRRYGR